MADPADKTAQIREQLAKPSARALLIVAIGLVMLVPLLLVQGLVGERMQRHDSVTLEIAECPVNTHGLRDARYPNQPTQRTSRNFSRPHPGGLALLLTRHSIISL